MEWVALRSCFSPFGGVKGRCVPRRVAPAPGGNYCEKKWKPANPHWPSLLLTVSLPRSIHAPRRPRQPILPRRRDRCVPARSTSAGVLRRTAAGEFYCRRGRRRQEIRVRSRLRGAAGAASITMPPSASPHTASCWPSGPRFPPRDPDPPGWSKRLSFPMVTDPAAPPLRPERHIPHSIATLRRRIAHALAQTLQRCPRCARTNPHRQNHSGIL